MSIWKKLFGKKEKKTLSNYESKTPEKEKKENSKIVTNSSERGAFMSEEKLKNVTYNNVDFTKMTEGALKAMGMLSSVFLEIEDENLPIYHPVNLDEYFYVWGSCFDFNDFDGIATKTENATFIALAFGKYLNENYDFIWKEKVENGQKSLVLWKENPKVEMYPMNSIKNAMQERRYNLFTEINEQFIEMSKIN